MSWKEDYKRKLTTAEEAVKSGNSKPIEELEVVRRFSPPLPACRACWKLLE